MVMFVVNKIATMFVNNGTIIPGYNGYELHFWIFTDFLLNLVFLKNNSWEICWWNIVNTWFFLARGKHLWAEEQGAWLKTQKWL